MGFSFFSSNRRGSHLMAENEKYVIDQKLRTKGHLVSQSVNGQRKIKQNKQKRQNLN
jgi:hypothetical protein